MSRSPRRRNTDKNTNMSISKSTADQGRRQSVGWVGGDEWDPWRTTIQELYQTQNLPLKDVMKIMEEEHGFRATQETSSYRQRMYKTRIKSWGLDKNFKECEVVELFRLRKERDRAGKRSTTYMIRGREVDWDRVQNYVRRKGLNITQLLASSSGTVSPCAREISCYTPPPDNGASARRSLTTSESQQSLVDVNLLRVSSPSSSSASPSPPNSSNNHLFSTAPIFTPISPAPSTALPPQLPILLDPTIMNNPIRRPSYPFPPPPPLPIVTPPPPPIPALYPPPPPPPQYSTSPLGSCSTLQNFQLFLTRLYKTTMFQDGERAWGTTDFFLRNMRSLEWLSTIRYSLAINRSHLTESNKSKEEIKKFKAVNRAFATLEPASKGVIGSRMFYIVNFLGSFYCESKDEEEDKGPFGELAGKLMEDIVLKCICGGDTDRESSGFGGDLRRVLGGEGGDRMDVDTSGTDTNSTEPRLIDEGISIKVTAERFLMAVLERMLREVGLKELPLEVVLLHELGEGPHVDMMGDWKPKGLGMGGGSCWRSCLLSPVSPSSTAQGEKDTGVSLLETGIWLAGYGDEVQAEGKFRALINEVKVGSPSPRLASTKLGNADSAEGNRNGRASGSAEMKVLARCAHYQLASMYRRRRDELAGREELKLSVKESVMYDHFVKWEDVEFLYT
ncbi:hypothetical protein B0T21DRAFT_70760 [Apiosordaria backusii]|uniref:Clr5 domain-containing protein n=1 Tax=Apiosordaria backusii TaxID=314023 RepID=A0AA40AEM6_9PEZI|nr:hypothetical protein B0T21DRAFT_70760 [Apiosordaria backusii]